MKEQNKSSLPFSAGNYYLMLGGILLIIVGFVVMQLETAPYGFGFLGITLGPILVLLGFGGGFWAIFYRGGGSSRG